MNEILVDPSGLYNLFFAILMYQQLLVWSAYSATSISWGSWVLGDNYGSKLLLKEMEDIPVGYHGGHNRYMGSLRGD
jgi:hypothetical protein